MKYLSSKIDQKVNQDNMYWRFFKQRRPSEDGPYLVHCPTEDPNKPIIHIAWWNKQAGEWELIPTVWANSVSHWMPLPPPPRIEVVL